MLKKLLILLPVLVSVGIVFYSCQQPITQPEEPTSNNSLFLLGDESTTYDLYAGQDILVGYVEVSNDGTNLEVKFVINVEGWCLEETHVAIAYSVEEIPQKNGNPVPGQFPYKHEDLGCIMEDTYTIPLNEINSSWDCYDELIIAAHAVVKDNSCELTGVVYGMERNTGDVYEIDVVVGTASISFSSVVPPPSNVSPNGLAYDGVNQRMYYCNYRSGIDPRTLYFYDYNTTTESVSGQIDAENAAADFYNGKYYYIDSYPGTDDLYEVILNSDGTMQSQTFVDISSNAHAWTFDGDIAIKEGILYGWGHCSIHNTYEFFTYDLIDGTFNVYNVAYQYSLQLAFGSDGTLYGHRSAAPGNFYVIDVTNGSVSGPITITPGKLYTDCASGMLCEDNFETAWGDGSDFSGKNWATYFSYIIQCDGGDGDLCDEQTAFGGNAVGGGPAWWFYYDVSVGGIQTIKAGQTMNAGTVEYTGDQTGGQIVITLTGGWSLQAVTEPVKIQGYNVIPATRPSAGGFTTYKGTELTVSVLYFPYYVIHLDVKNCPD